MCSSPTPCPPKHTSRYRLHIVGEVSLGIHHCLCALPGTKLEDITRIMSHPQVRGGGCLEDITRIMSHPQVRGGTPFRAGFREETACHTIGVNTSDVHNPPSPPRPPPPLSGTGSV